MTQQIRTILAEFRFPGGDVATVEAEPGKLTFTGAQSRLSKAARDVLEGVIGEHWVYAARKLAEGLGAEISVKESGELAMVER